MNTDTLLILLAIATLFVATIGIGVAILINHSKKFDALKDEIHLLHSKFDRLEECLNSTNIRVDYTIPGVERVERISCRIRTSIISLFSYIYILS